METLDAVADLTLAEGVHQIVTGNPVRAGALFDALGRGEQPPPEITVATTTRRSVHHTIRLTVAVPDDAVRATGDWPAAAGSIRAAAEPRADAWAAAFLGPAAAAAFTVTWTDSSGGATTTRRHVGRRRPRAAGRRRARRPAGGAGRLADPCDGPLCTGRIGRLGDRPAGGHAGARRRAPPGAGGVQGGHARGSRPECAGGVRRAARPGGVVSGGGGRTGTGPGDRGG